MSGLVRELEELSFRTLPALEQERYRGWVLRWSGGGSRRANSINPIDPAPQGLQATVDYGEAWFAARDTSAIFRLTPLAPPGLPAELADRGYQPIDSTVVMTGPIGTHAVSSNVTIAENPDADWLRITSSLPPDSTRLASLAAQLMTSGGRNCFASIQDGASTVAVGQSIDLDGYTTIYNMRTVPAAQGRGHAATILGTLLATGRNGGSTTAVLQVTQDNAPAQALYRPFGFSPVYEYRYWQRA